MSLFSCLAYVCISSIQQGTDDASLIDLMLCFSHTLFSASTSQQQPCQFRDWSQHHVNGYRICKSSCTWICLQLLVMCHWLRWRVELGNSAPWPQFLWCWLWDRSHHKLLRSFSGVSEAIMSVACKSGIISEKFWRGHGWFLIRLGIGSSWTACHREEYADRSHPYKTWTHVTEGVRRRSRSVGASSQPPCLLFSVFVTRFNGHKPTKMKPGRRLFLELCDPPNHDTTHPGLEVQDIVLERQVLIFTSYQAVAVALPKPLRQCLSSSTLRIMVWKNISTACTPKTSEHSVSCIHTCTRNAIIIGFRPSMNTGIDLSIKWIVVEYVRVHVLEFAYNC